MKTGTTLYIHKLRITSNERNTPALQLRQTNRLSTMSLHPANLSPNAIIYIRTVHDPRQQQPKNIPSTNAWEQAISANIKHELEHAAHPAQEEVADSATAIFFADHAELLACLASDWQQGKLTQRWWWRNLQGRQNGYNACTSAWLETPEHIPAALHHLATRGQAILFIRQLPATIISALLAGIVRSFALHTLQTVLTSQARDGQSTPETKSSTLSLYNQPNIQPDHSISSPYNQSNTHPDASIASQPLAINQPTTEYNPSITALKSSTQSNTLPATNQSPLQHNFPFSPDYSLPSSPDYQTVEGSMYQPQSRRNTNPPINQSTNPSHHNPPWQKYLPEQELSGLSSEQQILLAISLMLVRTPTIIRSPSFAHSLQQWLQKNAHAQPQIALPSSKQHHLTTPLLPRNNAPTAQAHIQPQNTLHDHSSKHNETTQLHTPLLQTPLQQIPNTQPPQKNNPFSLNPEIPLPHITFYSRQDKDDKTPSLPINNIMTLKKPREQEQINNHQNASLIFIEDTSNKENITPLNEQKYLPLQNSMRHDLSPARPLPTFSQTTFQTSPQTSSTTTFRSLPEKGLETAFGGLFYLINVGIYLELYGDFTTPAQPGIPLTIWDFLALLGFRLLGTILQNDPIWPLLSLLAGRTEQEPPGTYFKPLPDWHLPALWLKPFSNESSWQWAESQGRLYVYHPAGFLILDILIQGNREVQLKREMQAYTECGEVTLTMREEHLPSFTITPDTINSPPGTSPQVIRWLDWLTPYLSARLQRALGTNDDPIPTVCIQQAHIAVSTTHLDVSFSLATLPIEVRIAGLDRNPGWVPAAGRYVTFYFE